MSKRYKVKRFSSCYLMNWVDNTTNKELTALEIEEILHKQEKRIAELEEQLKNCIKPKFKIGQDVIVFDWSGQLRNGRVYEIQTNSVLHDKQQLITYLVDFYGAYEDDDQENNYYEEKEVFITREEAEQKLAEIGGKDD